MADDTDDTTRHDTIEAPIVELMAEGLAVYGAEGARIGLVRRFDLDAGYMVVEEGGLARRELYIPFHLMQSITPREISLRISREALTDAYLLPPAARTLLEEQMDPETGHTEVVIEHEIQSGYDGRPVEVAPVRLDEVTRTIAIGMTVLDVDDGYVGEVARVDLARGLLIIGGSFSDDAMRIVPFSMVAQINVDLGVVTLLVPSVAIPPER
jgi:hypothetical protein